MKKTVRPFCLTGAFLLIFSAFIISGSVYLLYSLVATSMNNPILVMVYLGLFILAVKMICFPLLKLLFTPKMTFHQNHIEIVHWKNGTFYNPKKKLGYSKSMVSCIQYDDLKLFGLYYIQDVKDYLGKGSAFLQNIYMMSAIGNIPLSVKLPTVVQNYRPVFLFVNAKGKGLIVDAKQYGYKQVQDILFNLEKRTDCKTSGRIQPKEHKENYVFTLITSCVSAVFMFGGPIILFAIVCSVNQNTALMQYSFLSPIFICSFYFANIALGLFIVQKQELSNAHQSFFGNNTTIFKVIFMALYIITGALYLFAWI